MTSADAPLAAEASTAAAAAEAAAPAAPPSTQAAAGPSDAPDADTEALAWALHRELNGLTRSSRRGGHKAPPGSGRGGASGAGSFDVSRLSSRRTSKSESRQRSPGALACRAVARLPCFTPAGQRPARGATSTHPPTLHPNHPTRHTLADRSGSPSGSGGSGERLGGPAGGAAAARKRPAPAPAPAQRKGSQDGAKRRPPQEEAAPEGEAAFAAAAGAAANAVRRTLQGPGAPTQGAAPLLAGWPRAAPSQPAMLPPPALAC